MSNTIDVDILRGIFAARVKLAKKTREEAAADAIAEWDVTQKWVKSESEKEGSFIWFCDEFDLDISAVRRAIREKRR